MLNIDLKNKTAFIAGVGDPHGFGWGIAKALNEAGAKILVGTWTPMMKIFKHSFENGKWDEERKLSDGSLLEISEIFPLDVNYDTPEDVPESIKENKRYKEYDRFTLSEVAEDIKAKHGNVDIVIHALANAPEIQNDLLDTSRDGYLGALNASSYSLIALLKHIGPIMNQGGHLLSLSHIAGQRVIPGYGGGMSTSKAALENDTRYLSWEAGRKWGIRVNTLSAGPMRSRAARAIGIIDKMITYSDANAPLRGQIESDDVAKAAAFLSSDLASSITGITLFVDNGLHAMGIAPQLTTHPIEDPI